MKIIQIMAGNKAGGAETAFIDMCIAMHQSGQDIEVITRKNEARLARLSDVGIVYHTLPFGGFIDGYTKHAIKKIIQKSQPDIVQTWMSRAAVKTPHWQKVKTSKEYKTVARLGGYYDLKYFKAMDYFVAVTPDLKDLIIKNGVDKNRITQINNFAETEEDIIPINRKDLNTPSDATVLLSLARLHENKALDIVIESLKDLPNTYLWLAGDGPLKEELRSQVKDLGLEKRVKFLGWRNDRSALLQAADICVFVSRQEPFGSVFIQSWANKTPVIVSDAEGPKQFCQDGVDSLMIPKNNAKALTEAIQKLQDDNVLQMKLVNQGYQKYLNEFTKEKSVQAYLDYYKKILSAS